MQEELLLKGDWFLPKQESKKVYGTLRLNQGKGVTLDLIGTLRASTRLEYEDIILGKTYENSAVTLYKCRQDNSTIHLSTDKRISGYSVVYVLIGFHYNSIEELKFNYVQAELKNLNNWLGKFGFNKNEFDREKSHLNIQYKLPHSIDFKINEILSGRFKFNCNYPIGLHNFNIRVDQTVALELKCQNEIPFDELFFSLIVFQNFLTLATQETSIPHKLYLSSIKLKNVNIDERVELIYNISNKYTPQEFQDSLSFLFTYDEISQKFESLIQRWYQIDEKLEPVSSLLMEYYFRPNNFNSNQFLNYVQAIETYHRRFRKNEVIPSDKHKERKINILKNMPEQHKAWLKERLAYSNEPTLRDRLEELICEITNVNFRNIIAPPIEFVKNVKNSRNYYTHYSKHLEQKALKENDLYFLGEKVKALLIFHILKEIGFEQNLLGELFNRQAWKYFDTSKIVDVE